MSAEDYSVITENFYRLGFDRNESAGNLEMLKENIRLIIENREVILDNSKFFFTQPGCTFTGSSVHGTFMLPVGILLLLWENECFIESCDECGGKVLVFNGGSSHSMGSNSWTGWCRDCRSMRKGKVSSPMELLGPAMELMNQYPNQKKFKRFKKDHPAGEQKLHETAHHEEVMEDFIEPVSFGELIMELKAN